MAKQNQVPVLIVNNPNYRVPTVNSSGQLVVSQSVAGGKVGSNILYDKSAGTYLPVTPFTVSPDYYFKNRAAELANTKQVDQERILHQTVSKIKSTDNIGSFFTDFVFKPFTTNDPLSTKVDNFGDNLGLAAKAGAVVLNSAFQEMQNRAKFADSTNEREVNSLADVLVSDGDKWDGLKSYLMDYVVSPMFSSDNFTTKTSRVINNTLVNLSETMDFFTGANAVKAFVQNSQGGKFKKGIEAVKKGYGVGTPYRYQYDWNTDSGNGAVDFAVNTLYEVLSDPTTWVTFGLKGIAKGIGKEIVDGGIIQASKKSAIELSGSQASRLSKKTIKSMLYNDESLVTAVQKMKLTDVTGQPVSTEQLTTFFEEMTKHARQASERRDFKLISSVARANENYQKMIGKSVAYTSSMGLGYSISKGIYMGTKLGLDKGIGAYTAAKLNAFVNKTDATNVTLKTLADTEAELESTLVTLVDVTNMVGVHPQEVVRRYSASIQEAKLGELRRIVGDETRPSGQIIQDLNSFAQKEGYEDAMIMANVLQSMPSAVPENLSSMSQDIINIVTRQQYRALQDTIKPVAEFVAENQSSEIVMETNRMFKTQKMLDKIGHTNSVGDTILPSSFAKRLLNPELTLDMGKTTTALNALRIHPLTRVNNALFKSIEDYYTAYNTLSKLDNVDSVACILEYTLNNDNLLKGIEYYNFNDYDDLILALDDIAKSETFNKFIPPTTVESIKAGLIYLDESVEVPSQAFYDEINAAIRHIVAFIETAWNPVAFDSSNSNAITKEMLMEMVLSNRYKTEELAIALNNLKSSLDLKFEIGTSIVENGIVLTGGVKAATDEDILSKAVNTVLTDYPIRSTRMQTEDILTHFKRVDKEVTIPDLLSEQSIAKLDEIRDRINELIQGQELFTGADNGYDYKLVELMTEWNGKGFTFATGIRVMDRLDRMVKKLTHDDLTGINLAFTPSNKVDTIVESTLYEDLSKLIKEADDNYGSYTTLTEREQVSVLYQMMLSKVQQMELLMTSEGVPELFSDITSHNGVGEILDILEDADDEIYRDSTSAILRDTATSYYVGQQTIARVDRMKIDGVWKSAIYDTLAGMIQKNIREIPRPKDLALEILTAAKKHIDGNRSAHLSRLQELSQHGDIMEEVENLHTELYRVVDMSHEPSRLDAEYWQPVSDRFNKDKDMFNLTYAATQTGISSGSICEFAFRLPDGETYKYVDVNARKAFKETMTEEFARKRYGKSRAEVLKDMKEIEIKDGLRPNVKYFDTSEAFAEQIYGLIDNVKQISMQVNATPRLVGFNTASESLNTDAILSDFTYKHLLNAYIVKNGGTAENILSIETLDTAQALRIAHEGAVEVTDELINQMTNVMADVAQYLERANARDGARATMLPDFNGATTEAMRTALAAVTETIEKYNTKIELEDMELNSVTPAQYSILKQRFDLNELVNYKAQLSDTLEHIGTTMKGIDETNSRLGEDVIIMNSLKGLTGNGNIMRFLQQYVIDGIGASKYSFKTLHNPGVRNMWFKDIPKDLTQLMKQNEVAKSLTKRMDMIKHMMIVVDFSKEQYGHLLGLLKKEFSTTSSAKFSDYGKGLMNADPGTELAPNYVLCEQIFKRITAPLSIRNTEQLMDKLYRQGVDIDLLHIMRNSDVTVFDKTPKHMPGISPLRSKLVQDSTALEKELETVEAIDIAHRRQELFEDELRLAQMLRESTGRNLPSERAKEPLIHRYNDFVNRVKNHVSNAKAEYQLDISEATTNLDREIVLDKYSNSIKRMQVDLTALEKAQAVRRLDTILTLSPLDYSKFLYKESQGIQVLDLGADVFRNATPKMERQLFDFMKTLDQAYEYGVRYHMDGARDKMFVYLEDMGNANLDSIGKLSKDFKLTAKEMKVEYSTGKHGEEIPNLFEYEYRKLNETMDMASDGMYSLSGQRTINEERFKELTEYLPEEIRDKVFDLDYIREHRLMDGKFCQNILGDYASGVGEIFTVYSGNLVTNVAAGFHSIYNKLRGQDMYKLLFFDNRDNELSTWYNHAKRTSNVTHQEIKEALKNTNTKVAGYLNGRVVELPIRTQEEFERAMSLHGVLMDYHTFTRTQEVLNDNQLNSKMLQALNSPLRMIKLGQLLSPGWVMRNIPDSTVKGWVQAGLDPMYMTSMFGKTQRIMNDYDALNYKIFKENRGDMSQAAIAQYFTKHPDAELSKNLYNKMLTFYSNSASSPTSKQLDLYRDIAHTLYQRIKDNGEISEAHVRAAVDVFRTYTVYKEAKAELLKKYKPETVDVLMSLRKYMPEKALKQSKFDEFINTFPITSGIMSVNNSFEAFIRMHTFLYHAEYTNGGIADAISKVDASQFNRSRDTKGAKLLEMLLPFSSFQMDNMLYWTNVVQRGTNLAQMEDMLNGMYDSEELDAEEMARNMSVQYLYMSGNLIINEETGITLKMNTSLHGTMQLLANPVGAFSEMLNVPMEVMQELYDAANANEYAYKQDPYNNTKPLSMWGEEDYKKELIPLIPLFGVIWQRQQSASDKSALCDSYLPILFPSMFGVVKSDESGNSYEGRPVGYDWYSQTQEYRDTHRYVFGVSYVPAWMKAEDPTTYIDTFTRLLHMGFDRNTASFMMKDGWYINHDTFNLNQFVDNMDGTFTWSDPLTGRTFTGNIGETKESKSSVGRSYSGTYSRGSRIHFKKFYLNKPRIYGADYNGVWKGYTRYQRQPRRVFRPRLYQNMYTKTGVAREALITYRGANRSSRQLLRDRSRATRSKHIRQSRQIRGY